MLWLHFIFLFSLHGQEHSNAIRCRKDSQYRYIFIEQQKNHRWLCQSVKWTHLEVAGFFENVQEAQTCLQQAQQAFEALGWTCDKINLKKLVW